MTDPTPIPPLPPGCNSYVATAPSGAVYELHNNANVRMAAAKGWKIETTRDYLARINNEFSVTVRK